MTAHTPIHAETSVERSLTRLQDVIDANKERRRRIKAHKGTRSHEDALRARNATTEALRAELAAQHG